MHLSFSGSIFLFCAILIAMCTFVLYVYRRTNPIIPGILRIFLILLRISVLLILLAVIFEFSLSLQRDHLIPPVLAVAVDNSASMTVTDRTGSRTDTVKGIFRSDTFKDLMKRFETRIFTFSSRVQNLHADKVDSIQFLSDATDITTSLQIIKEQLKEENLVGLVILSDGNYNAGGNPVRYAREIGVPTYTIGIGSTEPIPDLALVEIESNPYAYTGEITPVQVTIRNTGYGSINVPVTLKKGRDILDSKTVALPPSPSEVRAVLNYLPEKEGRQKLLIDVPAFEAEETTENNRRTLYFDVLKSRLKIVFLAGQVLPEISFLKRHLSSSDRYDVEVFVEKAGGGFYRNNADTKTVSDADLYILLDWPSRETVQATLEMVLATIKTKSCPVLLLAGKNIDLTKMAVLEEYLPVRAKSQTQKEVPVYPFPTPQGKLHQIMQIAAENTSSEYIWMQLPPLYLSNPLAQIWPNTEILAYASPSRQLAMAKERQGRWPLIVLRINGQHKSAAILAYSLWRWDLLMWGIGNTDETLNQLMNNLCRWLESTRSGESVSVQPDKTFYSYGEKVNVTIQVFDDKTNPVNSAQVVVEITDKGKRHELLARAVGEGRYTAEFLPDQPGDHEIAVTAMDRSRLLGKSTAYFTMGEYSTELTNVRLQTSVLGGLAEASGGIFMRADSLAPLNSLTGDSQRITSVDEKSLWNNPFTLLLIILLFGLEWFIRKRKGMV